MISGGTAVTVGAPVAGGIRLVEAAAVANPEITPTSSATAPLDELRAAQAAMGAALIDRNGDVERLNQAVLGVTALGATGLDAAALRKQAIAEAREQRVEDHRGGVAGWTAADAPTFDEWIAENEILLDDGQLTRVRVAYAEYAASVEAVWAARDTVLELGVEHRDLAPIVGQQNLDVVHAFWESRGVPLEIDGRRVNIKQWDEPNGWDNAYYDPPNDEIAFGRSGSGVPLSMSLDIVAHEYGHRVVRQLIPDFQRASSIETGAVDESMADVFAALVDPDGDWSIAEDITTNGMRDMDTQAMTYPQWEKSGQSSPHSLAWVPNGVAWRIGSAIGRDKLGDIYIEALKLLDGKAKLLDLAKAVVATSAKLYGADSPEMQTVTTAWAKAMEVDAASLISTGEHPAPKIAADLTRQDMERVYD